MSSDRVMVPRERLAHVVSEWIGRYRSERTDLECVGARGSFGAKSQHTQQRCFSALQYLSHHSGVGQRSLHRILNGPSTCSENETGEHVTLSLADRILVTIDQQYLLVLPPEMGGFADVYLSDDA